MGKHSNRALSTICVLIALIAGQARASTPTVDDLGALRAQIGILEKDLLENESSQTTAAIQLKKIKKLKELQQREIVLTKKRVQDFEKNLASLSEQKQTLVLSIEEQKKQAREGLKELNRFIEPHVLDARWLRSLDELNQKNYFISKVFKKGASSIGRLKEEIAQAANLEVKIIEEKNLQEYHVNELEEQIAQLKINEEVHREILKSNKVNRFEAFRRVQQLKESEKELQQKIYAKVDREQVVVTEDKSTSAPLLTMKGKLPLPVAGQILNTFGKFFDSKLNLLTFNKGITLGSSPSTEVKAIYPGKVVFSGPLKNYGLVTIIEHPGQYYSLYGQLGDLSVQEGAQVEQGAVLGKTSTTPFYFEIRDKNVAINPAGWLVSGLIVQGPEKMKKGAL